MKPKVFFIPASGEEKTKEIHGKILKLYREAEFNKCVEPGDLVAIKTHMGESGNKTHVPASYLRPLVTEIWHGKGKPFITDTCVLYKSRRSDAVVHLQVAEEHGFTLSKCGAPVIIADGLRGSNEIEIKIPGKLFEKVSIASEAVYSNAMVVISHVTGHLASGLGGAVKNLGMGLASRKGKLRQHSSMKPQIKDDKCTGCEECVTWCPENAISMSSDIAHIDDDLCIGCGECLTVCHFDAVKYNWEASSEDLQRKMAEHALGAVLNKRNKTCCFNFLMNITKDCDCFGVVQEPLIDDIGIVAGIDPISVDKASLDLIQEKSGDDLVQMSYPGLDPLIQLQHGEAIGLGQMVYELVNISG